MKTTLMAFGSRGDIQPLLGLAVALRARGHEVTLAAPSDFQGQIAAYGLPSVEIPLDNREFAQRDASKQAVNRLTPATLLALLRELLPALKAAYRATAERVTDAAQGTDLLIAHGFLAPVAYAVHQHLRVPLMLGIAAPVVATRAFPSPMFPPLPFGARVYNPLTYVPLVRGVLALQMGAMHEYRRQVGLPKLSAGKAADVLLRAQVPVALHYSRHLMPPPPDWNASAQVTGAWTLPAPRDWTPPEKLSAFLAQGEPPVYFGFGSIPIPNPVRVAQHIGEALRRAGLRGVLQAGWGGLAHEDEHLVTIDDAPHDWLFPRMAAVVHHGGSGTTHSAAA